MPQSGLIEQILLGVLVMVVLFLFWPGVKETLKRSREAQERDWPAVVIPLVLVALFVIFLISLV